MNTSSLSPFARLLATEAIRVVHKKDAETASFDIKDRVLTLPLWTGMSREVYDMLIGHEVAHALFTDAAIDEESGHIKACMDIDPDNPDGPKGVLNIVEDARIERLIKAKYPGIKRDFVVGYRWLWDNEIFPIEEMGGISNADLIDRLNLHFKLGIIGIIDIPFSDEERIWVDRLENTQTFEDVVEVARDLYQKIKAEGSKQFPIGDPKGGDGSGAEDGSGTVRVRSQEMMDQNISQQFTDTAKYSADPTYTSIPSCNIKKMLVPAETISEWIDDTTYSQPYAYHDHNKSRQFISEARQRSRARFDQWFASEQRTVNYMVKQFEMRKAADQHKRTMITKSGRLDTVKMINHRWSEDIFAKNQIIRDGKNHGFNIILDWSGSMSCILMETTKQAMVLAMFCQKAGIPFELQAFSDRLVAEGIHSYNIDHDALNDTPYDLRDRYDYGNTISTDITKMGFLQMLQFVRSGVSRRDFIEQLANLFFAAEINSRSEDGTIPGFHLSDGLLRLQLNGTPLNEALVFCHTYIPQFIRKHGVQVMNTVVLTDGDANWNGIGSSVYNPKTGNTYGDAPDEREMYPTNLLVKSLREQTGTNMIGIYLSTPRTNYGGWIQEADRSSINYWEERDRVGKEGKKNLAKNGFLVADGYKAANYTEAYIINSALDTEQNLVLDDNNHAALKRSFLKGMAAKSMSRPLINRFVDKVAC